MNYIVYIQLNSEQERVRVRVIHELEFVRELAIHLSKKDNKYVTQFSVVAHVPSK